MEHDDKHDKHEPWKVEIPNLETIPCGDKLLNRLTIWPTNQHVQPKKRGMATKNEETMYNLKPSKLVVNYWAPNVRWNMPKKKCSWKILLWIYIYEHFLFFWIHRVFFARALRDPLVSFWVFAGQTTTFWFVKPCWLNQHFGLHHWVHPHTHIVYIYVNVMCNVWIYGVYTYLFIFIWTFMCIYEYTCLYICITTYTSKDI